MNGLPITEGYHGAPIRTAVVGLGWAGSSIWLPRLHEHPAFTVTAVVDTDPVARSLAAQGRTGTQLLSGVEELTPDMVDLAIVAVPNHLHTVIACKLLANGIPVFVEKPVCLSSAEAEQLAAAERVGGAVLLAGSAARFRADVRSLHGLLADIGRLRHVEAAWVRARGVPDAGGWFTSRERAGGGALVDLGWHLLDSITPILGPVGFDNVLGTVSDDFVNDAAVRAVWRYEDQAAQDRAPRPGGDVEDTARGFLVTEDGVSVALRASWASHEATDSTLIRLDGSAGTATLQCTFGFSPNRRGGSVLTLRRAGETTEVPVPEEPIGAEYVRQLDELPGLLADPASRGRTVEEVRRTIGVIERLYASARPPRPTAAARPGGSSLVLLEGVR